MTAQDLDVILVPRGYHVVGAAAGYDTWYLNVMAGPERVWRFTVDPDHALAHELGSGARRGRRLDAAGEMRQTSR